MLTCNSLGRYGRFGNQLFQIAGVIGIAQKMGYSFGFREWINHDHRERFGSEEDIDVQKYFVNPLPKADTEHLPDFPIPWGYHPDLKIPDNVSISGHLQSDKYFLHCLPMIRHFFKMQKEPFSMEGVAIHVRWGDYDNQYHPRLGLEYYERALHFFPPGTPFTLFSDEPDGAMKMFEAIRGIRIDICRRSNYLEEFAVMKRFHHFITGNSSFSLMAAILGEYHSKKIICPANWFGPAWGPQHKQMAKDIYPQKCITI